MKKIDLKGNVAVMYSPGYGAGWSTWNDGNEFLQILSNDKKVTVTQEMLEF